MFVLMWMACAKPEPVTSPSPSPSTETETGSETDTEDTPPTETETADTATPGVSPCPCVADYDADQIVWWESEPHLGVTYGQPSRDELVVFYQGSKQEPENHRNILSTAAYAGFRVVGVQTQSTPKPLVECNENHPDQYDACVASMHRAKIYGSEHADFLSVTDDKSVVGRTHEALVDLEERFPGEGWSAYFEPLPDGAVDHENYIHWDKVILSGFSQGAQKTAVLAIDHWLDGVVVISGPPDDTDWVTPGATPTCAWWALHHADEDWSDYHGFNYDILGFAEPVDHPSEPLPEALCDEAWPPYQGSQRLVSALRAADSCTSPDPAHGSMANDVCMNVDEGEPGDPFALFRTYLYAYCAAGHVDADPVTGSCSSLD